MSGNRRFEFKDGSSNKFWEISADDENVTTVWGRIGTDGQSKTKSFSSIALAEKEYDKLVKEKTAKGYVEIKGGAKAPLKKATTTTSKKTSTSKITSAKVAKASTKSSSASSAKTSAKKGTTTKVSTKKLLVKVGPAKKAIAPKAVRTAPEFAPNHFDDVLMKHAHEMPRYSDSSPKKYKHGKYLLDQSPEASLVILRAAFRLARKAKKECKDDTLYSLRSCLLRRNLPFTLKDIEFICNKVSTALTFLGIDPILLRPIEYWVASDPTHVLSETAKNNLSLIRNNKKRLAGIWEDQTKHLARIDKLLGKDAQQVLIEPDCPWSIQAAQDVAAMKPAEQEKWKALLLHCVLAGNSPKEPWVQKAKELMAPIGATAFQSIFQRWIERVAQKDEGGQLNFVEDTNEHVLCGLARCCIYQPTDRTPALLGALATAMYRKLPGIGPRSVRVGNACIAALGTLNSIDSISQLAIVKSKIKAGTLQRMVAKQLEACVKSRNTSLEDLVELTIPSYGLTEVGARVEACEKLRVKVVASSPKSVDVHWYDEHNKPLSKLPGKLSAACADWVAEIKRDVDELKQMLIVQRDRVEGLYYVEKSWRYPQWRERYLEGLVVGVIARTLIWTFKEKKSVQTGIWHAGKIVDSRGKQLKISDEASVSLWHPLDSNPTEIKAWRNWVVDNQIQQSLKQAFREVYLVTDAEKKTKSYSNRFAAHILRQSQFRTLAQQRGWKATFLGGFDGGECGDTNREFPHLNLTARFMVDAILSSQTEGYAYKYVTSDRVKFTSPIGWKGKPQPVTSIPPVVFSEVMRDVDMFVGVCSVGNDPNWKDRGSKPDFQLYWSNYSTADLAESGKSRHAALAALLPRMKFLQPNCQLRDKYLRVQGKKHAYLIHLGSSNIRVESTQQYLCIAPKTQESSLDVVLPFEGDYTLTLILSKALMLVDDHKITDQKILTQLPGK